jgi:hypothetical protein
MEKTRNNYIFVIPGQLTSWEIRIPAYTKKQAIAYFKKVHGALIKQVVNIIIEKGKP